MLKLHKMSETLIPSNKKGKKNIDKTLIDGAKKIRKNTTISIEKVF